MSQNDYEKYQEAQFVKYDSICNCCGECCGANNDPCANLIRKEDGKYNCKVYNNRLGPQETVSGKLFTCVPIRDNIKRGFCSPSCAYVKK